MSTDVVMVKVPTRLADVERLMIERTLKRNCGVQAATCRDLDISPSTLYRKLKAFRKAKRK
jgi:DNA-binding NtrC family response regulator